jgi:hypothetical protein
LLSQLGRGGGISSAEHLRRIGQHGDGDFVARFRAARKLSSHLDRKRAPSQQHVSTAAIQSPPDRGRHAGPHRVTDQVVPEGQPPVELREEVSLHQRSNRWQ